jgi:5-formyltetrahydrofolate cyclo-ligase
VEDAHVADTLAARKRSLRASARAARRSLRTPERQQASTTIVARLQRLPDVRDATTILLYAAQPTEVDLGGLVRPLRSRGARTLFPRVVGEQLDLVAAADLRTLELGYRGIREPAGPRVGPEVVDVAIVPGVAFDPLGGRLGQGGGHYDRLLARLPERCLRIGVCFACQMVPRVPRSAHDEAVDLVVTEHALYRSDHGSSPA